MYVHLGVYVYIYVGVKPKQKYHKSKVTLCAVYCVFSVPFSFFFFFNAGHKLLYGFYKPPVDNGAQFEKSPC